MTVIVISSIYLMTAWSHYYDHLCLPADWGEPVSISLICLGFRRDVPPLPAIDTVTRTRRARAVRVPNGRGWFGLLPLHSSQINGIKARALFGVEEFVIVSFYFLVEAEALPPRQETCQWRPTTSLTEQGLGGQ